MELLTTPFLPLRISKRLKCGYFKFKLQKNIHEYSWILKFHENGDFDKKKCRFSQNLKILVFRKVVNESWKVEILKNGHFEKMEIFKSREDVGIQNTPERSLKYEDFEKV